MTWGIYPGDAWGKAGGGAKLLCGPVCATPAGCGKPWAGVGSAARPPPCLSFHFFFSSSEEDEDEELEERLRRRLWPILIDLVELNCTGAS